MLTIFVCFIILLLIKPILLQESEKFACNIPTADTCLTAMFVGQGKGNISPTLAWISCWFL